MEFILSEAEGLQSSTANWRWKAFVGIYNEPVEGIPHANKYETYGSALIQMRHPKQPIGYHLKSHPFTNHEIQLQKGDCIYIYSDGFADQFGGPKGKKLKYKQLDDLIIANQFFHIKEQKEILKKRFKEWKGSLEQIDDVCIFGVRV